MEDGYRILFMKNIMLFFIFLFTFLYTSISFTQHLLLEHPKRPHKGCEYAKMAFSSDELQICQNNAKKSYKLFRDGEGYEYTKEAHQSTTLGDCKYNAQKGYYRSC